MDGQHAATARDARRADQHPEAERGPRERERAELDDQAEGQRAEDSSREEARLPSGSLSAQTRRELNAMREPSAVHGV
jgi:hypothetical protein